MLRIPRMALPLGLVAILFQSTAVADSQTSIDGWRLSGNAVDSFLVSSANSIAYDGSGSAYLASVGYVPGSGFGTLMQSVNARLFRGKRLEFSAYVMTANVSTGAALWMRVDGHDGQVLSFDNMSNRPTIRGSQSWTRHKVVLEVPPDSKHIAYGVLLKGTGKLWIDSVSLETVFRLEAVTGLPVILQPLPIAPDDLPATPANLGFELSF